MLTRYLEFNRFMGKIDLLTDIYIYIYLRKLFQENDSICILDILLILIWFLLHTVPIFGWDELRFEINDESKREIIFYLVGFSCIL